MDNNEQLGLFDLTDWQQLSSRTEMSMSAESLMAWKQRIFEFQSQIQIKPLMRQKALWNDAAQSMIAVDEINPFALPQLNIQIWRWSATNKGPGVAALYFVIDYALPVLLYVGETKRSSQRWEDTQDCDRYLQHYRRVHYNHQVPTQLGVALWRQAPQNTKLRQNLEAALIDRWRSPFNKKNWQHWGMPFGTKL